MAFSSREFHSATPLYCEKCVAKRPQSANSGFCDDCDNRMYMTSNDIHLSVFSKFMRNRFRQRKPPQCDKQKGKYLEIFCFDHFECVCENDLNKYHRKCRVKPLELTSYMSISELELVKFQVSKQKENILQSKEHKLNDISGQKEYFLKQIDEHWKKIMGKIKQCKRRCRKGADNTFNEALQRVDDDFSTALDDLEKLEMSLTKQQESVNLVIHYHLNDLPGKILAVNETTRKFHEPVKPFEIPDYLISFEEYVSNLNCTSIKPTRNTADVSKDLSDLDFLSDSLDLEIDFGNCNLVAEIGTPSVDSKIMMEGKVNTVKDIQRLSAKRIDSLNIKISIDKDDCCITGLSVCNDGNLLLVDCYNRRLKLVSPSGNCISSFEIPGEPFDVTTTNYNEAAVSMWMNQKEILLYDLKSNSTHVKKSIKLRNRIYGISAVGDDFAISCDDKIPSVNLVNRAGETKWSVSFRSDGRKMFRSPTYVITHSLDKATYVVVSDTETHTIVMIEAKSGSIFKTIPQSTVGPLGLTMDSYGNIYVGYCYKAGINIWSPTMNEDKVLLSSEDNMKRPQAVAFNQLTNELFISSWRCNEIERFQIQ